MISLQDLVTGNPQEAAVHKSPGAEPRFELHDLTDARLPTGESPRDCEGRLGARAILAPRVLRVDFFTAHVAWCRPFLMDEVSVTRAIRHPDRCRQVFS